jgi:release factor glutamine methyltransferase
MTRAADALTALRRRLGDVSQSADLDAELLVAHVLGLGRAALAAGAARDLSPSQADDLCALAERRLAGEPVAYLTGRREFWSLELEVTPDVLVPRPETELLVEMTLDALGGIARPAVLDLGTGSGAIALAIASERNDAAVTAVDASDAALAVARRNAERLRIGNVRFLRGSWYEPAGRVRFDAIVSNPPYVAAGDPALAALTHEPRAALVAGPDGLDALRTICRGAASRLVAGGVLIVEHGATQGGDVSVLMNESGLADVATHRDLAGLPRATRGAAAH